MIRRYIQRAFTFRRSIPRAANENYRDWVWNHTYERFFVLYLSPDSHLN